MWSSEEGIPGRGNSQYKGLRWDRTWKIQGIARRPECLRGRGTGEETEWKQTGLFRALGCTEITSLFSERTGEARESSEESRGPSQNTGWCFHRIPACRADRKGPGQEPGAWLGGCRHTAHLHQTVPAEESQHLEFGLLSSWKHPLPLARKVLHSSKCLPAAYNRERHRRE